jgi:hypothetical protein
MILLHVESLKLTLHAAIGMTDDAPSAKGGRRPSLRPDSTYISVVLGNVDFCTFNYARYGS